LDWKGLTERRTEKSKAIRRQQRKVGRDWSPRRGKEVVAREDNVIGAVTANPTIENTVVSGQMTTTNTPAKSTEKGSPKILKRHRKNELRNHGELCPTLTESHEHFGGANPPLVVTGTNPQDSSKETSEQLTLMEYQNTTSSVRDFLANLSVLLGSGEDLKILEAHSSLRYAESYGLKDLAIYGLRTSGGFSPTMTVLPSKPLSERWMNWGMTVSGRCLTARISASPRTGRGCSLSDILEESPDQKYFLSEKAVKFIMEVSVKNQGKRSLVQFVPGSQESQGAEKHM